MWKAASTWAYRRHVIRITSTALIAGALLTPGAGRSDEGREAPQPPTGLELLGASPTSLSLSWEVSHGRPIDGYALFLDGASVGTTAETSYTFEGLSCGMSYALGVEAYDSAGNHSERGTVVAATAMCSAPAPLPPPPPPEATSPPSSLPSPPAPSSTAPPLAPVPIPPEVEPPSAPSEPPGPEMAMSWAAAGAFVWHEADVDPQILGRQMRENGFGWVAVRIHDGMVIDPVEQDWIERFREASGLPVGGWGVLRAEPEREAALAQKLLSHYTLDFYIANAEAEYKYSGENGVDAERFQRSQRFLETFRGLEPDLPAALSSYCRADNQDIDWKAWSAADFAFLPQAYVNDFGAAAAPAVCTDAAARFFPPDAVHPTIGMYRGQHDQPDSERYAALLGEARTVGFSVYLAETMDASEWPPLGNAIDELGVASRAPEGAPKCTGCAGEDSDLRPAD